MIEVVMRRGVRLADRCVGYPNPIRRVILGSLVAGETPTVNSASDVRLVDIFSLSTPLHLQPIRVVMMSEES